MQIEILITTSNTHTIRSLETDRDSFQASYCYVIGALPASQDMFPVPFNEGFHLLMVCFNLDPHGLRHFLDKGIVFLIPAAVKPNVRVADGVRSGKKRTRFSFSDRFVRGVRERMATP